MENWQSALAALEEADGCNTPAVSDLRATSCGEHQWNPVTHSRPMFCNYCREKLSGVPWHGMACDICRQKAHKRCMSKMRSACKWTSEHSVPAQMQYITPDNSVMAHQWVEGNLPMGSKCTACERACGSVLKLQDWRCLWCAVCAHDACLQVVPRVCSLGPASLSILPPLALRSINDKGVACLRVDAMGGECGGGSPLLALVNSKSGDNQGQRMIRKLRRLLNPVQVFDIISSGPDFGLTFMGELDSFRVLVCGGDGTVGWVLAAFDRLGLHSKCQLAVLPLGTGNDLARVLGWGHAFYDDHQLPKLVATFERAHTRMLDRWSVLAMEGAQADAVMELENEVSDRISAVIRADTAPDIIAAVKRLCETVRGLAERVSATYGQVEEWEREQGAPNQQPLTMQCKTLLGKLDKLMKTLAEQEDMDGVVGEGGGGSEGGEEARESGIGEGTEEGGECTEEERARRDSIMGRANSLKKALKDMMDAAEKSIDKHNRESAANAKREKFRKKRSKTTPSTLGVRKVSCSNLSSSSAASPPASPSHSRGGASTVDREESSGGGGGGGGGEARRDSRLAVDWPSQSSGCGASPALSSPMEPVHIAVNEEMIGPLAIGIQPPTPGERSREKTQEVEEMTSRSVSQAPSEKLECEGGRSPDLSELDPPIAVLARAETVDETSEGGGGGGGREESGEGSRTSDTQSVATTGQDSLLDRPAISPVALFKPTSESQLLLGSKGGVGGGGGRGAAPLPPDIKTSHSDSSIYEHADHMPVSLRRERELTWKQRERERERRRQEAVAMAEAGKRQHPVINRGLLVSSGVSGGSLIAELLLLNARVLGAAGRLDGDGEGGEGAGGVGQYKELKVMNNYFGIGLDAKIALDFHNKREESDKTRSRSKLFLWYGMLGGKELMHRTYRNLDQRIRLECDGVAIELPSLQGIVILNIPSYSGGANFWGTAKDDTFSAQSFDDKVLEVVALFGVMHVASSRVPNAVRLQNHRIAQCRHVRITIRGDEPIPVQVDGEPWLQPPGVLHITHKNRAQLLVRNPAFEATLRTWEEKQEKSVPSTPTGLLPPLPPAHWDGGIHAGVQGLERMHKRVPFLSRAGEFIQLVESGMAQLGLSNALLEALEAATTAVRAAEKQSSRPACSSSDRLAGAEEAAAAVECVVELLEDHFGLPPPSPRPARLAPAPQYAFQLQGEDDADGWRFVLNSMRDELSEHDELLRETMHEAGYFDLSSSAGSTSTANSLHPEARGRKRSRLAAWLRSHLGRRKQPHHIDVWEWSVGEVAEWLGALGVGEYAEQFTHNDISGRELVHLEKSDLKDLGVSKIGHVKRILSAIGDVREASDRARRVGSSRKGTSLSVERAHAQPQPEQPSLSSL